VSSGFNSTATRRTKKKGRDCSGKRKIEQVSGELPGDRSTYTKPEYLTNQKGREQGKITQLGEILQGQGEGILK